MMRTALGPTPWHANSSRSLVSQASPSVVTPAPTRPRTAGRGRRRDGSSSGVVGSGWVGSFMAASLSRAGRRAAYRGARVRMHMTTVAGARTHRRCLFVERARCPSGSTPCAPTARPSGGIITRVSGLRVPPPAWKSCKRADSGSGRRTRKAFRCTFTALADHSVGRASSGKLGLEDLGDRRRALMRAGMAVRPATTRIVLGTTASSCQSGGIVVESGSTAAISASPPGMPRMVPASAGSTCAAERPALTCCGVARSSTGHRCR